MNQFTELYLLLVLFLLIGAAFLHLTARGGNIGKQINTFLCSAPGIDLALAYFMLLPLALGSIFQGWLGAGIALLAELTALWIWIILHELTHPIQKSQKIHPTLSRIVGGWRNHLAVWITSLAIPVFWLVRFAQWIVYPPLTWLVRLPKYNAKDWINVSRHKFEGLVGYDLIWCLYCDWMTGVWSLGTEMLRNVESFWCPIRFYSEKKCANCQIDFPDLDNGWVNADATMKDVTELLKTKYTSSQTQRSWFGHQERESEKVSEE